jgi:phage protein D
VNGQIVQHGLVSAQVVTNTMFQADTWQCVLVGSLMPTNSAVQWYSAQKVEVEIYIGFPKDPTAFGVDELGHLLTGFADSIEYNPVTDTVTLAGRDLTGLLIDHKTYAKYPNLTASQIAQQMATKYGLKASITATTVPVGRYYSIDHVRTTTQETDWDLLTFLAQESGFWVYVYGDTLYFGPPPVSGKNDFIIETPIPGKSNQSNVLQMTLARNLTVARDVIVQVSSWDPKHAKGFTATAKAIHGIATPLGGSSESQAAGGDAQIYSYTIPGLSPQQALARAQQLLHNITIHELRLQATMPAVNTVGKQTIVKVKQSGTIFDQDFYPSKITRTWSAQRGYLMTIDAKNHSPQSTVMAGQTNPVGGFTSQSPG